MPLRRRKARTRPVSNRKKRVTRNKQKPSEGLHLCPSCGELSVESCKCGLTDDAHKEESEPQSEDDEVAIPTRRFSSGRKCKVGPGKSTACTDAHNEESDPQSEDDDVAIPTRRFSSGRKCKVGPGKSTACTPDRKRVNNVKLAEGNNEYESHLRNRGNTSDNATNAGARTSYKSENSRLSVSPSDRRTRQSSKLSRGSSPNIKINSPSKILGNTRGVKKVKREVTTSSDGSDKEEENDLASTRIQGALNDGVNVESRSNEMEIPDVYSHPCLNYDPKVLIERTTLTVLPRRLSCDTGPSDDRCSTSGTEGFESGAAKPCLRRSARIRSTSSEECASSKLSTTACKDLIKRATGLSHSKSIDDYLPFKRIAHLPRSSSEENVEFDDQTKGSVGVGLKSNIINRLVTSDSDSYEGDFHPRLDGPSSSRVRKVGKARTRRTKNNSVAKKNSVAKESQICNGPSKIPSCDHSDLEIKESSQKRPCVENRVSTSSTTTQTCAELSFSVLSAWSIEESTKKSIGVQKGLEMRAQTTQTDNYSETDKDSVLCGSGTKLSDLMLSCVEKLKSELGSKKKNVMNDKESKVHSNFLSKILQEAEVSSGASKRGKSSVHNERSSSTSGKLNNKDEKANKVLQNDSLSLGSVPNQADESKHATRDTQDKVRKRKTRGSSEKPRLKSISDESAPKTLIHSKSFDMLCDVDSSSRSSSSKESHAVESDGSSTSKKISNVIPKSTSRKKETKANSNIVADNTAPVSKRRSSGSKGDKGEKLCVDDLQSQTVIKSHTVGITETVKSASKSLSDRDSSKQNVDVSCANIRNKNREKFCDKSTSRKKHLSSSSGESESRTVNHRKDSVEKSLEAMEAISSSSCSRQSVFDECAEKGESPSRFPTTIDTVSGVHLPSLEQCEVNGRSLKEISKESDKLTNNFNVVDCAKTSSVHSTDTMLESEQLPSAESRSGGIHLESVSELQQPSVDEDMVVTIKTEVEGIEYDDNNDDIISIYPDNDYDPFLDDFEIVESSGGGIRRENPYFSVPEVLGSEKESQNAETDSSILSVPPDPQDPIEITSSTQVGSTFNGVESCGEVTDTKYDAERSNIELCEYDVECDIIDYPDSISEVTTSTHDSDFELGDALNTDEENSAGKEPGQDMFNYVSSKVDSEEQKNIRKQISLMTPPFGVIRDQSSHIFKGLNEDIVEGDGTVKNVHTLDSRGIPVEHLRTNENLNTTERPAGTSKVGSQGRQSLLLSKKLPSCLIVPSHGDNVFKVKNSPILSGMCFTELKTGSCACRKFKHKFDKDVGHYADVSMSSIDIFRHIRFAIQRKLKSFMIGQGVELAEVLVKRQQGKLFSDVLRLYCHIGLPMHRWKILLQCIERCGSCDQTHVKNVLKFIVSNYLHRDSGIEPHVYDMMIDLITSLSCEFHSTNSVCEVLELILDRRYWFSEETLEKMLKRCVREYYDERCRKLSFTVGNIICGLNAKFDPNSSLGKILKEFVSMLHDHDHSILSEKIEKMIEFGNLSSTPFSSKDDSLMTLKDQGVHSIPVIKSTSHLKRNSSHLVDSDIPLSKKPLISINQSPFSDFSHKTHNSVPSESLKDMMNPYGVQQCVNESTASTSEYFSSASSGPLLSLPSSMDDLPNPAYNLDVPENCIRPDNEEGNDEGFPIPIVVSHHSPTPSASSSQYSQKRASRTVKSSDSCLKVLSAGTTEKKGRSPSTGQTLSQVPIQTDDLLSSFKPGITLNRTSTPLLPSPGPELIDLQMGSSSENIGNLEVVGQSQPTLFNPNVHAERKCNQNAVRGIDANVNTVQSSISLSSAVKEETSVPVEESTLEEAVKSMTWSSPVLSKYFVPHLTTISFNKDVAVKLVDLFAENLHQSIPSLTALVMCMESKTFTSTISTSFYNQMKRLISTVIFNLVLKMIMIDSWTGAYELLAIANSAQLPVVSSEAFIDEEISMSRKILVLCEVCFRAHKMKEAIDYLKLGNLFGQTPEDWMYDSMDGDAEVQVTLISSLIGKLAAGAYCSLAPSLYLEIYRSQLSIKEPVDLSSHVNNVIICALNGCLINDAYEVFCTLEDGLNDLPKLTHRAMLCGMVKAKEITLAREFYSAISSLQMYPSFQEIEGPFVVEVESYWLLEEVFVVIDHVLEYLQGLLDCDPRRNQDPNFSMNIIVKESDPPDELNLEQKTPVNKVPQDPIPNCLAFQTYSLESAVRDVQFALRSIMKPPLSSTCEPFSEGICRISLKKSTLVNHLISRSFYQKGYNDDF